MQSDQRNILSSTPNITLQRPSSGMVALQNTQGSITIQGTNQGQGSITIQGSSPSSQPVGNISVQQQQQQHSINTVLHRPDEQQPELPRWSKFSFMLCRLS